MRKLILAALAATTLLPVAAQAQDWRHDRQEMRHDRQEARREIRDDRRELREDRRDAREDWRAWRERNRDAFRMRPYAGPRGYTYRTITPGYRFAPTYYASRYWINNPGDYRLPVAGAGLRWVRYGNDVALVNIRTGRVIEVHNRFFW